jgi:hypothetical protein
MYCGQTQFQANGGASVNYGDIAPLSKINCKLRCTCLSFHVIDKLLLRNFLHNLAGTVHYLKMLHILVAGMDRKANCLVQMILYRDKQFRYTMYVLFTDLSPG